MIDNLYILPSAGMIAVGVIAIIIWYLKTRVHPRYFLYGGILWAIAIGIKIVMDYTITYPMQNWLLSVFSFTIVLFIMSLYFGLRTGVFENGITYLGVKYTGLSGITFNEAVALGIGFGSFEAILLGADALYKTYTLLQPISDLTILPPVTISQEWLIGAIIPAFERTFAIFGHVFATVLVVYSVKLKDLRLLGIAFVYKTICDGSLFPLLYYLGHSSVYDYMKTEVFVAFMGIIGLAGLFWIKKNIVDKVIGEING
jgi:uncharacterized membrane protein YhfC